jgi:hypothetical protein
MLIDSKKCGGAIISVLHYLPPLWYAHAMKESHRVRSDVYTVRSVANPTENVRFVFGVYVIQLIQIPLDNTSQALQAVTVVRLNPHRSTAAECDNERGAAYVAGPSDAMRMSVKCISVCTAP